MVDLKYLILSLSQKLDATRNEAFAFFGTIDHSYCKRRTKRYCEDKVVVPLRFL